MPSESGLGFRIKQGKEFSVPNGYAVELKSGTEYSITLFNKTNYHHCAEILIDGFSVGRFAIDARQEWEITRPASVNKKFAVYREAYAELAISSAASGSSSIFTTESGKRIDTAPLRDCGIQVDREENGTVRVFFRGPHPSIRLNGFLRYIDVDLETATVRNLKHILGLDSEKELRIRQGERFSTLDESMTLRGCGIARGSELYSSRRDLQTSRPINIFLKMEGKSISFTVSETELIEDIKQKIEDNFGIPFDDQCLVFDGKQLEEGKDLVDYNIQRDSTIRLLLKLRGGDAKLPFKFEGADLGCLTYKGLVEKVASLKSLTPGDFRLFVPDERQYIANEFFEGKTGTYTVVVRDESDPQWRSGVTTLQGESSQTFSSSDLQFDDHVSVNLAVRLVVRCDEDVVITPQKFLSLASLPQKPPK